MIMFVVFVRLVLMLAAVAFAVFGGLLLALLGDTHRATGLVIFCGFTAWMARPDNEELHAFAEFQKQRAARLNVKL
jgi:hypothetical protein